MKIIHVTQHLGIGGLEKIIFHILQEQIKLGHDVSIYVYDHNREWVPYFKENGINVISAPIKKNGYSLKTLFQMNQKLVSSDIIHTHDLNPIMYLGPLILLRKIFFLKVPKLIHTTHGLSHIERHKYYTVFEKFITPLANKIIGVSEKVSNFYFENLWWGKSKIRTIENGIKIFEEKIDFKIRREKKEWICNRHNLDMNRPILLSLSRVVPLKDQEFLIHAVMKRPELQLIIAGPGQDINYYNYLKKLENKNIKLIGPQEAVSDYNLGSDIYLSASTHEGIPVALLEAMAVKTPVLASNIPGHLTLNNYEEVITTYQIGNQNDFLLKLDEIIDAIKNNPNLIEIKTTKAKKIVDSHYSVKSMVEKYLNEYSL